MKKRKQHYVWEHYLKAWSVDGQVWCRRGSERRFRTSTDNIAHRRDFYRLEEMSERDVQVVETLIAPMSEEAKSSARVLLTCFRLPYKIKHHWKATGRRNLSLERHIDVGINNLEEDMHASVEAEAIPLLAALREGDSTILGDDEHFAAFARFVAMQYMRTPGVMRRAVEAAAPDFSFETSWGLMRTIFANNLGAGLCARRDGLRLSFLSAPSEFEFVTGDQPIVNVQAVEPAGDTPPTRLELYYPLTPTRALLMDFHYGQAIADRRLLSMADVATYNQRICSMSDGQAYARSESALIGLR